VENIQNFSIEDNPFPDRFFDAIICINVLHSAKNRNEFLEWFEQLVRMLNSGGLLLLSLQSQIGLSRKYKHLQKEESDLAGIEDFYLLTESVLKEILELDYLKTFENTRSILIDNENSFTYLFLEKSG
jgi:SAM-dependent methyltransferase